jgi:serine/threonine protein kinase
MTTTQSFSLYSPPLSNVINFLDKQGLHVDKKIGDGTQGIIYTLRDTKNGKITNVLKTMSDGEKFNPKKGAHLLTNVQHRNICRPTQFFYTTKTGIVTTTPKAGSTCLASIMPYIEGSTLMNEYTEISKEAGQIFRFGLLLCQAVHELSKHKISHNDLHNANILVDKEFNPFIIDFDLANNKSSFVSDSDYGSVRSHLTKMIKDSADFNPKSKEFLLHCLTKCNPWLLKGKDRSHLPSLMVSFMQACIDHLNEIKPTPEQPPVSKL